MTQGTGKRRPHLKDVCPKDPALRRLSDWLPVNRSFYLNFLAWLRESHYSASARNVYGVAARQVIGFLDKPYWAIDLDGDLDRAWEHLKTRPIRPSTLAGYHKGLLKFGEYLRLRLQRPARPKSIHWEHYLEALPPDFGQAVRHYIQFRSKAWKVERRHERTQDALSHLTRFFRWLANQGLFERIEEVTPNRWYDYLDSRLEQGFSEDTVNGELAEVQSFLHFLADEQALPVCERMFLVKGIPRRHTLPKDVPLDRLRRLFEEIQTEATSIHQGKQRCGRMDLAWFLLMLHSGLRTCEVRSLRFEDLDLANRKLRIEQSKGLKDRIVYLNTATLEALEAYRKVRGPTEALPEQVFIYAHRPLSESYCSQRLVTYGQRCGVRVTPHQLRHSCATLLLNAGAPVLTVQTLLGHKWVDTTLGYARLYDGTVAADYYAAMGVVEQRLALPEDRLSAPPGLAQLVTLADSLQSGTLTTAQAEAVRALRSGLRLLLAEQNTSVVKVPKDADSETSRRTSLAL